MVKYIMRKTIYKEFDKESQDILLQLTAKQYIIELICFMFWVVIWIFPFIPIFIIDIFEDIEFSMTTKGAIMAFMMICFIGLLVSMKFFKKSRLIFSQMLAKQLYFLVCTTKGKALSKDDFNIIQKVNEKLYTLIATQMCRRYCYYICFEMCKSLKKGNIEFLAIKNVSSHDDEKDFTMHVLYVNNGWAFDTYSSRQYPIKRLHEIYKAKIYKTFSFDEISSKSYKEFREEQEPKLAKWAIDNECSVYWKSDNEDT